MRLIVAFLGHNTVFVNTYVSFITSVVFSGHIHLLF